MASIEIHGKRFEKRTVICPRKKTWKEQEKSKCYYPDECKYYRGEYSSVILCHYGEVKGWENHIGRGYFGA